MTDQRPDRAEEAFRAAFRAHDAEESFEPIDPASLRSVGAGADAADSRRRPRWGWLGAAAAAVLAVPLAGALLLQQTAGPTASQGAAAPTVASRSQQADAGPEAGAAPAQGTATPESLPKLRTGYRYESMGDVVVQVPETWGYGAALGTDWCAEEVARAAPTEPFVDVNPVERGAREVACEGGVPERLQRAHLTWTYHQGGDADGSEVVNGYAIVRKVVGSVVLGVYVPEGEEDVARTILATARRVAVDHNGCDVRRGIPAAGLDRPSPAWDAGTLAAGRAAVCQYTWTARDLPNLIGSRALDADGTATLLDEVRASPSVSKPTPTADCAPRVRLVVRLQDAEGARELWLTRPCGSTSGYAWDDGTTYRRVTRPACRAALGGPLEVWSGEAGDPCTP